MSCPKPEGVEILHGTSVKIRCNRFNFPSSDEAQQEVLSIGGNVYVIDGDGAMYKFETQDDGAIVPVLVHEMEKDAETPICKNAVLLPHEEHTVVTIGDNNTIRCIVNGKDVYPKSDRARLPYYDDDKNNKKVHISGSVASPDGRNVIFTTGRHAFVYSPDDNKATKITIPEDDNHQSLYIMSEAALDDSVAFACNYFDPETRRSRAKIVTLDLNTKELKDLPITDEGVTHISVVCENDKFLAVGDTTGDGSSHIMLYDKNDLSLKMNIPSPTHGFTSMAIAPDNNHIILSDGDLVYRVNIHTQKTETWSIPRGKVAIDSNGIIYVAGRNGFVTVIEPNTE